MDMVESADEAVGCETWALQELRKIMSAPATFSYTLWYERQRLTRRVGTSPPPGRPAGPGRVLRRGSRRLPRRRPALGPPLGRRVPTGGRARPLPPPDTRAATQVDDHPGEDRPTM